MTSRSSQSEYESSVQSSDISDRTLSSKKSHKYETIASSDRGSKQASRQYERSGDGEKVREREGGRERSRRKEKEREEEERSRRKEREREEEKRSRRKEKERKEDSRRRDKSNDRYTSSIAGKSVDSLDTLGPSDSISNVGRTPSSSVAPNSTSTSTPLPTRSHVHTGCEVADPRKGGRRANESDVEFKRGTRTSRSGRSEAPTSSSDDSDSTVTPLPPRSRVSTISKSKDRKSDSGKGKKREVEFNHSARKQDSGNSVAPSIISNASSRAPSSSVAPDPKLAPSSNGSEVSIGPMETVLADRRANSDIRSDYNAGTRVFSNHGSNVSGATAKQRFMIPVQLPQSGTSKDSDPSESTSHGAPVNLIPRNITYSQPLVLQPHPHFKSASSSKPPARRG
ncbi:hypothetical protein BPOR_0100g00170 [Botrytis porri]|uniref:Uncharacterized protein n=1 Tax=Botrytis porri TaxID=87229 RepID=A0A4Z1KYI3_9HELO|nr:hypothetical protein BPOR_0100g00170 [Botrytis porri]